MTHTTCLGMPTGVTTDHWKSHLPAVTCLLLCAVMSSLLGDADAVDLSQVDGKGIFDSLRPSKCSFTCPTSILPVCGTDDVTYLSRCELKRAKKCDRKRIKVKHKGRCQPVTSSTHQTQCLSERHALSQAARHNNNSHVPTCNKDGSYSEVQCYKKTGWCWCAGKDGKHIPGTSTDGKPRCKGKKKKMKKLRGGKTRRKKNSACNSKDRKSFNAALIKQFKEEYERVNPPTSPPASRSRFSKADTEKAIVVWKFKELDKNKDEMLKFKEIRSFGRMVRKLIKPKPCAKRFLKHCDKNKNRTIDENEWTICLGVDFKYGVSRTPEPDTRRRDVMQILLEERPAVPGIKTSSGLDRSGDRSKVKNCSEERELALLVQAQDPKANPFIPVCTSSGQWEKSQCHQSATPPLCWCAEQSTGDPIPFTVTKMVTPNCTFENERPMKGCPLKQKRHFLVSLIEELTQERQKTLLANDNKTNVGPEDNLSLRETVARWKLKSLDKNNNGILERKEWRPLRKTTLKNKSFPRRCRRGFLRYCDVDKNKKITQDEWTECLGLKNNYYTFLPVNPHRQGGKNPFMDQLT